VVGVLPIPTADVGRARSVAAPVDAVLAASETAPREARRLVRELAAPHLPPARLNQLLVALSEAVSNAVLHAYPHGSPGVVRLKAWTADESAAVLVLDEGTGFEPTSRERGRRTGLGMGIDLMHTLASEVVVDSRPGTGTAVLLMFRA